MTEGRVLVIGAGTMGHGIAQVAAMAGFDVGLHDMDDARIAAGLDQVDANLAKGVARGKVTEEARLAARARLSPEPDVVAGSAAADLVVEAVPENPELKAALYARLGPALRPDALLASNTSSLSIAALAEHTPDAGRFLGLHFFNPVHIMTLVEVVHGPATSAATLERALTFVATLGKEAVVVRDSPGFASSRLGVALGMEAIRMLEEEVASAEDIDKAMTLGYRHPMGPLRLTDLVGLDVRLDITRALHDALGSPRFEPPPLLERMVAEGKLGKKSGQGFYDWTEDG